MNRQRNFFIAPVFLCLLLLTLARAAHAASGDLDPTFGQGGIAIADLGGLANYANALAVQPDGKVLVGGSASVPGAIAFGLARLNSDGSPDTSFGNGGTVFVNLFGRSVNFEGGLALQPDGKIVAVGYVTLGEDSRDPDLWIMRFNSDGTFDQGFGTGGLVLTDLFSHSFDFLTDLAVQPDGRILAAGGVVPVTNDYLHSVVVRYLPDGRLDPGFGTGGKAVTNVAPTLGSSISGIALQSDGKIVAAGPPGIEYALARYDSQGRLDPSFGGDGIVTPPVFIYPGILYSVAVQPEGKIVAGGTAAPSGSDGDFALWRFLPDGSLDPQFGVGGRVWTDFSGINEQDDQINSLALQEDGGIVAVGRTHINGDLFRSSDFAVARYTSDGQLDTSFGTGGKWVKDFFGEYDAATDVVSLRDGRFLVTGIVGSTPGSFPDAYVLRFLGPELAVNQPPVIAGATASPGSLWPPNHKMTDVLVSYTVTDDRDPAAAVRCSLTVSSNEPVNGTGDGDTAPDWQIVDSHHVRLRAERAGSGNGRIYTITITCQDTAGATSQERVMVKVPKNQKNRKTG
jgi:uncharacterized delta-60 repeat protein